jgi:hypothetical protein
MQEQLATEGPYEGRFTQPNYREWHEGQTCYGMQLPWYTIGKDRIFSTIGDPEQELDEKAQRAMEARRKTREAKRRIKPQAIDPSISYDHRYAVENPKKVTLLSFEGGMITIVCQRDDVRTIAIDSSDDEALLRAQEVCQRAGAEWLPISRRWLTTIEQTKTIIANLKASQAESYPDRSIENIDPLPPAPEKSPLRPNAKNPRLFHFDIGKRRASVLLMEPLGNWVILPSKDEEINQHIHLACEPFAPQKPWDGNHKGDWTLRYNAERKSWIIRDDPPELIDRVVTAIQNSNI